MIGCLGSLGMACRCSGPQHLCRPLFVADRLPKRMVRGLDCSEAVSREGAPRRETLCVRGAVGRGCAPRPLALAHCMEWH